MKNSDSSQSTAPASSNPENQGVWAIVPLKPLELAKKRLSAVLQHSERQLLMRAMVQDVVAALKASAGIDGILLVSRAKEAADLAATLGVAHWQESLHADLSEAVQQASEWLTRIHRARATLVIPGDVPLVTAEEIGSLLKRGRTDGKTLVLVPDQNNEGTNCVFSCPPNLIPYHYDGCSFKPHQKAAEKLGLAPVIVHQPGIELDIDLPRDLTQLLSLTSRSLANRSSATLSFLKSSGIASRMMQPHNSQSASATVG